MSRKKIRYLWGGILNKNRFKEMKEENEDRLKQMDLEESIRLTELFLSSRMFDELRRDFIYNEPVSLKLGLRLRKNVRAGI